MLGAVWLGEVGAGFGTYVVAFGGADEGAHDADALVAAMVFSDCLREI